ncbi:MAG TPA: hypothetical protein VJ691_06680 [Vicinamibacterales bacterium]|nr:hypothetical protein [Vicinamibacterales bacterium]
MRNLCLIGALVLALMPSPAQAQADFIKDKLKDIIQTSGVYVSMSSRTPIDNDVDMGRTFGIGWGMAGRNPRDGKKYPFSFSSYSGNLETDSTGARFGRFKAQQIMSGIGYQWVRGKMKYGAQVGVGYSFNKVTLDPGVAIAFGVPEPVGVDVSNSWVVRPQAKAEYFLHSKLSLRTQLSYTYTDPDVVIRTVNQTFTQQWRPHHVHLSVAVGVFPFR